PGCDELHEPLAASPGLTTSSTDRTPLLGTLRSCRPDGPGPAVLHAEQVARSERNAPGMPTLHTIGIDFGTANSCVAYAAYLDRGRGEVDPDPLRRPEVLLFNNRDTIPSAIHRGVNGHPPVFGYAAEDRAPFEPQHF